MWTKDVRTSPLDIERAPVPLDAPTLPTAAQFDAMLSALDKGVETAPAAAVARLLAFTGARQNEARHLEKHQLVSTPTELENRKMR